MPNISIPLVFVDDLDSPELSKTDRHHFEKVLRVKKGDEITISDGKGSWRSCLFGEQLNELGEIKTLSSFEVTRKKEGVKSEITQKSPTEDSTKIGVGFCPLKGGRSDLVVAKLTEVGVDYMTPFFADRSVVKFDEKKFEAQKARWQKIIRVASMQSRRVYLPELTEVGDFISLSESDATGHADILQAAGVSKDGSMLKTEETEIADNNAISFIMVGPEGGWSDAERKYIKRPVNLGPNVLRSETAAILAGAYLVQRLERKY